MENKVDIIFSIEEDCFFSPFNKRLIEEAINSKFDRFHLVKDCAYINYRIIDKEAELIRVAVKKKDRKKGYAKLLLKVMLEDLRENAVETCFLEVRKTNEVAINLYKKFGFSILGIRKEYYENPLEDAIIMSCKI